MVKLLVLQQWHRLSDPELERQITYRISFRKFLGFLETIPDYTTVWQFRKLLTKTDKDRAICTELQRQLDSLGLYFGYKLNSKVDTELCPICELETTTASVHDSQVDLSREGEVVYRDRGYQGAEAQGYSATMREGARDYPLEFLD